MPLGWQLQVLEQNVRAIRGDEVEFQVKAFWEFDPSSGEDPAMELVRSAAGFPAVALDGKLVCAGAIDLSAVVEALGGPRP